MVQGALVEMESPLRSEHFDEDEWVESVTRIVPVLLEQSKQPPTNERLTYL
jgi:hypothetical protein